MKRIFIVISSLLFVAVLGYFAIEAVSRHIDRESGALVERSLSAYTVQQLQLLSEIEVLIQDGELNQAKKKISKSKETMVYILKNHCASQKCNEVVLQHESR